MRDAGGVLMDNGRGGSDRGGRGSTVTSDVRLYFGCGQAGQDHAQRVLLGVVPNKTTNNAKNGRRLGGATKAQRFAINKHETRCSG